MAEKTTDAESVTPDQGADTGNALTDFDRQDFETMKELIVNQQDMITRLAEQVETLSKTAASSDLPPVDPADFSPAPVAEGWKRYASRFGELTLMRVGTGHEMHGGVAVPVPVLTGKAIDFTGGVFETDDPEVMEFIETHEDFNTTFWQDDYAVRRHSNVEVTQGVKTSAATPRAPLAAPMRS